MISIKKYSRILVLKVSYLFFFFAEMKVSYFLDMSDSSLRDKSVVHTFLYLGQIGYVSQVDSQNRPFISKPRTNYRTIIS